MLDEYCCVSWGKVASRQYSTRVSVLLRSSEYKLLLLYSETVHLNNNAYRYNTCNIKGMDINLSYMLVSPVFLDPEI